MDLPTHILVPFSTCKLRKFSISYHNPLLSSSKQIDDWAYIIPYSYENYIDRKLARVFKGERYGGDNIFFNGGGVRCGNYRNLQVKGVGRNSLAGRDSDDAHSNGELSMLSALYEVVWGEILNDILPHRAVRAMCVIDTHTPATDKCSYFNRALLVREVVARLAHFERAIGYRPYNFSRKEIIKDVWRVKTAIPNITFYLPKPKSIRNLNWEMLGKEEKIRVGLGELMDRLAWQFAKLKSKNIVYGISSSNISTDGRLLDFSAASVLPYPENKPTIIKDVLWCQQWRDDSRLLRAIRNICYYLYRYLNISERFSRELALSAAKRYSSTHREACNFYFIQKLGFPAYLIKPFTESEEYKILGPQIQNICMADHCTILNERESAPCSESHKMGSIAQILLKSRDAKHKSPTACNLDTELIDCYGRLYEFIKKNSRNLGVAELALQRSMILNIGRYSLAPQYLNRSRVTEDISKVLSSGDDSGESFKILLSSYKNIACVILKEQNTRLVTIWTMEEVTIAFDLISNKFIYTKGLIKSTYDWEELIGLVMKNSAGEFTEALEFYGLPFWTLLSDFN